MTSTIKCESEQEGVVFPRRKHYEHASTTIEGEEAHWTQGQDFVVLRDADRSAHTGALVLIVCSSDTKRKCRATRSGGGTTGLVRLRNQTHLVTHSDEFTCCLTVAPLSPIPPAHGLLLEDGHRSRNNRHRSHGSILKLVRPMIDLAGKFPRMTKPAACTKHGGSSPPADCPVQSI